MAVKHSTAFTSAIKQLSYVLEREKVKTIIKLEDDQEEISASLKEISALRERVNTYMLILQLILDPNLQRLKILLNYTKITIITITFFRLFIDFF